ncbi:hypothetical protein [Clostridium perfringens]|uniref:hypothetical protein n=1 Tax=Clostridium perfringens TaxID=1502 RepID=UPI0023427621|nr:hypothetical protein [Clostridium perfringens]MDC4245543.1 hypothetical protein [Clostridium perfringens]
MDEVFAIRKIEDLMNIIDKEDKALIENDFVNIVENYSAEGDLIYLALHQRKKDEWIIFDFIRNNNEYKINIGNEYSSITSSLKENKKDEICEEIKEITSLIIKDIYKQEDCMLNIIYENNGSYWDDNEDYIYDEEIE